jgi:hypothetical protein
LEFWQSSFKRLFVIPIALCDQSLRIFVRLIPQAVNSTSQVESVYDGWVLFQSRCYSARIVDSQFKISNRVLGPMVQRKAFPRGWIYTVTGNFMRPNQHNNNKQRNRNRNRRNTGGGGGGGGGPSNKVFDSNGPDVKLRGTTQTIAEKYMQMGRDAQSSGDGVAAENYYQHAEHYYRLWAASQPVGHSLQMSRKLGEEEFDDESDDAGGEDDAEGGNMEAAPAEGNQPLEGGSTDPNAPQGEGQQRPFRNNNYRDNNNNNNNRNARPRWQNNRNNRNYENRDNAVMPEQGAVAPVDAPQETQQFVPPAAPMVTEAEGQWEAPSFLQRPSAPAVEASAEAVEEAPAPRKYKPRKPRVEADATPDESSGSAE